MLSLCCKRKNTSKSITKVIHEDITLGEQRLANVCSSCSDVKIYHKKLCYQCYFKEVDKAKKEGTIFYPPELSNVSPTSHTSWNDLKAKPFKYKKSINITQQYLDSLAAKELKLPVPT